MEIPQLVLATKQEACCPPPPSSSNTATFNFRNMLIALNTLINMEEVLVQVNEVLPKGVIATQALLG